SKWSDANRTDENQGVQSERSSYGRSTGSGNDVHGGSGRLYGGYEKRFNDGSFHDGPGFYGNGRVSRTPEADYHSCLGVTRPEVRDGPSYGPACIRGSLRKHSGRECGRI